MIKYSDLKICFRKILESTHGNNTSDADIIDYKTGYCISIDELKDEYIKYKELEAKIDKYIEDNNLDSVNDSEQIKEYFKNEIDKDLFIYNQGFLRDFTDYMIKKIDKINDNAELDSQFRIGKYSIQQMIEKMEQTIYSSDDDDILKCELIDKYYENNCTLIKKDVDNMIDLMYGASGNFWNLVEDEEDEEDLDEEI